MSSPLGPTDWQFVTPQLPVRNGRETQLWGMREFTFEDNNGHRFRVGHSEGPVVLPEERGQGG